VEKATAIRANGSWAAGIDGEVEGAAGSGGGGGGAHFVCLCGGFWGFDVAVAVLMRYRFTKLA
jgi:hypothetical protein